MLEARDLTFGFGGLPLFSHLDLAFDAHERVALIAPSGFGKTTLCRLLAGYEKPDGGQVIWDGQPLPERGLCPVQLIGQNPQAVLDASMRLGDSLAEADAALKPWRSMTVFGGSGREGLPSPVRALIESVGIRPGWLHRYPHELSGGELQRFCIARALLARPRFLIADEITTMLDAYSTAQLWQVIESYLQDQEAGLIFVSHDSALVKRIATRRVDLLEFA